LNQLGERKQLLKRLPKRCVLTPHPGEMARLTGLTMDNIIENPLAVAREYAEKWGAVVVLKGAPSYVARPDGMVVMNPTGNPGMASGGTGDVLTGMIGGLLAQGLSPWEASVCGVWSHGAAGDRAAESKGVLSMMASDMIEEIPRVLRDIGFEPVVNNYESD
jgi:hydroxyethylthiazole kinase-like uncharacterized protein yjeF